MIHIAIVEDEKEFAQTLQDYIQRYMAETHTAIQTDTFHDGMSFLDEYSGKYQIVFMDIAMPHMNGYSGTAAEGGFECVPDLYYQSGSVRDQRI